MIISKIFDTHASLKSRIKSLYFNDHWLTSINKQHHCKEVTVTLSIV